MKNKPVIWLLVVLLLLTPAGCCGSRDIANMAFVTTIGLDTVEPDNRNPFPKKVSENIPNQYKVSAEIVKPGLINGLTHSNDARIIRTASGESIEEALHQMQTSLSRQISLTHLRVLIIGEKMARHNFKDITSFFEKHPAIARRLRIMFVQDMEARDVLNTTPLLERYTAEELIHMVQLKNVLEYTETKPFASFMKDLLDTNGRAIGTRVAVIDNGRHISKAGAAVFNRWKLAAWLNAKDTRNVTWLIGNCKVTITFSTGAGDYTYLVDKRKTSVQPVIENGQLKKFKISIKTQGIILQEQGKYVDLGDPGELSKLERKAGQTILEEANSALNKAQKEIGIDYVYFGKTVKQRYPALFAKLNWPETFRHIPVEISVKSSADKISLSR